MSDKRPHIKPEELAGLICQYLAGELDDKAMHDLERQALDDPFLAEALEGYAQHIPEQQAHQADLASRLADRVAPKAGKVRTMYYRWAAAAAILLLMFSAGWFLWDQQRSAPPLASVPVPAAAPVADSVPQGEREEAPALAQADNLAKQVTPPVPAEPKTYKLKEQRAALSPAGDAAAEKSVSSADEAAAPASTVPVTENAAPAPAIPAPAHKASQGARALNMELRKEVQQKSFSATLPAEKNKQLIDRSQSSPLPNLSANADSQSSTLKDVVVTGYGTQKKAASEIRIRGVSTLGAPDSTNHHLEEVIIGRVAGVEVEERGAGSKSEGDMAYRAPAPVTGETAFSNYLRTKTVNPENKYNGTVRVSFTVMPDGSLQDFKILRHLNEACDAEAIRVIKEGPAWAPASDRKPAKVKVKVKFTVQKD
jgi:TonB family protein